MALVSCLKIAVIGGNPVARVVCCMTECRRVTRLHGETGLATLDEILIPDVVITVHLQWLW